MLAASRKSRNCVIYRGSARSGCQSGCTALESGNSALENILRGVCESAVNIARVTQSKAVCGVLRVVENVRCARVNRHCTRVGNGVGGFLTYVELFGFKAPVFGVFNIGHCDFLL